MKNRKASIQVEADKSISKEALRELEVISRYHNVDYENKKVVVTTHIKKISAMFVEDIDAKAPIVNDSFLESASNIVHAIPEGFNAEFDVVVDDYEGYNPKEVMHSIRDSLEIFNYNVNKNKKTNTIKMSLLLFLGTFFFAVLFYMCALNLFGDGVQHNIIHEIVYTVACVLLWEGIYILFLPESSYNSISQSSLNRIHSIVLLNKNKKILISNTLQDIKADWVHNTKKIIRWRRIILFAGTGMLIFAGMALADMFSYALNFNKDGFTLAAFVINIIVVINGFLCGFSALSYYLCRGRLRLHLRLYSIFGIVFDSAIFVINLNRVLADNINLIYYFVCEIISLTLLTLILISSIALKDTYVTVNSEKKNNNG